MFNDGNPMPHIEIFNKKRSRMNEVYDLQNVVFEDTEEFKEECLKLFPESSRSLEDRQDRFDEHLANQFK